MMMVCLSIFILKAWGYKFLKIIESLKNILNEN